MAKILFSKKMFFVIAVLTIFTAIFLYKYNEKLNRELNTIDIKLKYPWVKDEKKFTQAGIDAVPGQYLVFVRHNGDEKDFVRLVDELVEQYGGELGLKGFAVKFFSLNRTSEEVALRMSQDDRVISVSASNYVYLPKTPSPKL